MERGQRWNGNRMEESWRRVRATLEHCGGCTVTQADRGENQSMNNPPKYNERGSHLTEGKTREKSLRFPHCQ